MEKKYSGIRVGVQCTWTEREAKKFLQVFHSFIFSVFSWLILSVCCLHTLFKHILWYTYFPFLFLLLSLFFNIFFASVVDLLLLGAIIQYFKRFIFIHWNSGLHPFSVDAGITIRWILAHMQRMTMKLILHNNIFFFFFFSSVYLHKRRTKFIGMFMKPHSFLWIDSLFSFAPFSSTSLTFCAFCLVTLNMKKKNISNKVW